jgi:hypothetical protein
MTASSLPPAQPKKADLELQSEAVPLQGCSSFERECYQGSAVDGGQ